MQSVSALLATVVFLLTAVSAALANPFEGAWIGAYQGRTDWVYIQVRLGGHGSQMTGRIDVPMTGLGDMLLERVSARDHRVRFEVPAYEGNLHFTGELRSAGRVTGSVTQGRGSSPFVLLRSLPLGPRDLAQLVGDYQMTDSDEVVLVHARGNALFYVHYASGRMGRLFLTEDGRYISGPTVLAGYPIELTVTFERDAAGTVVGLRWERRGTPIRRAHRRSFYQVEDASFSSQTDVQLSGSLLLPQGAGPHPAVVIVPGSGRVTRDALLPYADSFARRGVAVLIHDKRGTGASTGDYARAGIEELAADARAGVEWLAHHPSINAAQIGLVGTSLGGWVAPLVATRSSHVKFIIIEAAPAVTPAEHERMRVENEMRADRQPPAAVARALAYMDRKFLVGRTGKGWGDLEVLAAQGATEGWVRYVSRPTSLESLRWNWQHVLSYDPQPVLRQLRVPVLALYGELDRIVQTTFNRKKMEQALRAAGNTDVTVRVFPKANHHFLLAITGGPDEGPLLKGFVGGYFDARVEWLLDRLVGVPRPATAG
jgi:dipeptidyl aminopeptidase/acylaminoacyl peptidase